ncbi:hypothetical protein Syun_019483 [Stephania yunnanensis]|uniref:Uncharacterized protein n=1 Tax=Stephania yunnanensis TaxID=152371 RepID=A0AAP0IU77_9MAGN
MWTLWSAVGVMVSESVGANASEYLSHSRHRHIQCEGLEMIREKRGLDGRDKEITYCVSTMCGMYGASVKWTNAEYASVIRQLAPSEWIFSIVKRPLNGSQSTATTSNKNVFQFLVMKLILHGRLGLGGIAIVHYNNTPFDQYSIIRSAKSRRIPFASDTIFKSPSDFIDSGDDFASSPAFRHPERGL